MKTYAPCDAKCAICCRLVSLPYRGYVDGVLKYGCCGKAHEGHLEGADLVWHNKPEGKALRAKMKAEADVRGYYFDE